MVQLQGGGQHPQFPQSTEHFRVEYDNESHDKFLVHVDEELVLLEFRPWYLVEVPYFY
jgi:hypothetical protein